MTSMLSVLKPTEVTSAMLVSSTVAEDDHPPWNAGTTYGLGVRCISPVTHKVYESAKEGNINHDPTELTSRVGSSIWWIEISMTNRWNALNYKSSVQTVSDSPQTYVVQPGATNAIYLNWLDADEVTVSVKDKAGGVVVFSFFAELECSYPSDFYEFCFAPYRQQPDIVIEGIPAYLEPEITVTLTKVTGKVKCGALQFGDMMPLGKTLSGVKAKPKGGSYIATTVNNESEVRTRRRPSKDLTASALVDRENADVVLETAGALIDIPCLWSASSSKQLAGLRAFGLGFVELSYDHNQHCILNLTVNGIST